MKMKILNGLLVNDFVILSRAKRPEFVGLKGKIIKIIKSRNQVVVDTEGKGLYFADVNNVDKLF